jgi:hypothetical protein
VIAHGIPHIEPFTLHQGLHFVMHQWLSATMFALIYDTLGSPFLYLLVAVIKGFIIYSVFRLCVRVSEGNFLISFTIALAVSIPLDFFMVPRPNLFSIFVFSLELNLLETGVQTKPPCGCCHSAPENDDIFVVAHDKTTIEKLNKFAIPCGLPILSVLLINLHAAMWPFFFVLMIPYVIDGFRFSIWGVKGDGYPVLPLGIAAVLSFAAGWINPYGFESMTYLFRSYGNAYISAMIVEMQSPDFKSLLGIMYFTIYFIPILIYCFHKGQARLRYALLMIGTGFMGLSSARSLSLFLVCAIPFLAHPLKSVQLLKTAGMQPRFPWLRYVMMSILVVFLGSFFFISAGKSEKESEITQPIKAVNYIKTHLNNENIRLYTSFNAGGYSEFQGLRPFIDTRAEVFCKSNNQKENIIDDYFDVAFGKTHYRELIKKYELTHFLVGKTDILNVYLPKDPDFEMLFSDDNFKVFTLKTLSS